VLVVRRGEAMAAGPMAAAKEVRVEEVAATEWLVAAETA
jgi:hypothetical protein